MSGDGKTQCAKRTKGLLPRGAKDKLTTDQLSLDGRQTFADTLVHVGFLEHRTQLSDFAALTRSSADLKAAQTECALLGRHTPLVGVGE